MTENGPPELDAHTATARLLERIRRYVEQETPSDHEAELTALAAMVASDLESAGATVAVHPAPRRGVNLLADVRGRTDEAPVLVLAHIDTVHPLGTLARRPFRVEDGRAWGPGVYDMKAGLAVVVEALHLLREAGTAPRRPVRVLVTCDEEVGSHSSHDLIVEHVRQAGAVLVPEPCMPDGGVKTTRKGVATYRIQAQGRTAHAGIEGASSISAIRELVLALNTVLDLAMHERGTTINIGTITGGTASNVVAAAASAVVDVRLAEPGEGDRVHGAMMALRARHPDAHLDVTRTESRPPLVRNEAVAALYQQAREIAATMGTDLREGGTGGGSDGSIAAAAGAATLDGLGVQGAGAHAENEHILLSDLPFRLAFMTRLMHML